MDFDGEADDSHDDWVPKRRRPRYGETVVALQNVLDELYRDYSDEPHDDSAAAEMNRLRGMIMAQCGEVETAMGQIIQKSTQHPMEKVKSWTAGKLIREVRKSLGEDAHMWEAELQIIQEAVRLRNAAVHSTVRIGSVFHPYATGYGGDWVPVVSLMGSDLYDEADLLDDLALQQEALVSAASLLKAVSDGDLGNEPPPPGWSVDQVGR